MCLHIVCDVMSVCYWITNMATVRNMEICRRKLTYRESVRGCVFNTNRVSVIMLYDI